MKIAYYMPFKPIGHSHPSGDLIIGTELFNYLQGHHDISLASYLRCRWIYYRPDLLLRLVVQRARLRRTMSSSRPDLWLTYHSYYKAPDLIGSHLAAKLNIPYIIFQGIYSTKRRRSVKTLPGFLLNRKALLQADHIFTNKKRDHHNLQRLIPSEKLTYIAPGIHPESFPYSEAAREQRRNRLQTGDDIVILTVAMLRSGVKSQGVKHVIDACAVLHQQGYPIRLVVVGDGEKRRELEQEARLAMQDRAQFVGLVPRERLSEYYSSGDIFAFPGINESLGMVYLEAQSCRLPVVAFRDWGGAEAVVDGLTGLLSPAADPSEFKTNIEKLVTNKNMRLQLGAQAEAHVQEKHNLLRNYRKLELILESIAGKNRSQRR